MTHLLDPKTLLHEKDHLILELRSELSQASNTKREQKKNELRLNHTIELLQKQLSEKSNLITQLEIQQAALHNQLGQLYQSTSWKITRPMRVVVRLARAFPFLRQRFLALMAHYGGGLRGVFYMVCRCVALTKQSGLRTLALRALGHDHSALSQHSPVVDLYRHMPDHQLLPVTKVQHSLALHDDSVSIIVCVHNALDDVERCLTSILQNTLPPYELIVVDDGSAQPTATFLAKFAAEQSIMLIRNELARGYTFAANQGMQAATADYLLLLNSDTVVSEHWIDRLFAALQSAPDIGIVGPLSNTASWQSIPAIEAMGDWADNNLPAGWSIEDMARRVAATSLRLYPGMTFLNGFCLLIRKAVVDQIGYFDEENFGAGYGEENDFCLRARKQGWSLALADDCYVFHHQSKSYSHERRKQLCDRAGIKLEQMHGNEIIQTGVGHCRHAAVLEGIRARAQVMEERYCTRLEGKRRHEGRRLLFLLPVLHAGGGANIVITEALAMQRMGVDAYILNLSRCKKEFEAAYPDLGIPVIYVDWESDALAHLPEFDAVVATANHTVQWLQGATPGMPMGYYIQDYEPFFFKSGSPEAEIARRSYNLLPDLIRFTKTEWNRSTLWEQLGLDCHVVGPSYDSDLYLPREKRHPSWPNHPLRICAMVRPSSPRRGPRETMQLLQRAKEHYQDAITITVFGTSTEEMASLGYPLNFDFTNLGTLSPEQLANEIYEMDVFVDLSTYQAMGLTAMEAMACGCAVIVPQCGGTTSFARDKANALIIDTTDAAACFDALTSLIEDNALRQALQKNALFDLPHFYPEKAALNILNILFPKN